MGPLSTDSAKLLAKKRSYFQGLALVGGAWLLVMTISLGAAHAQNALPFEVSNPKNKKWSPREAGRIYASACDLLARTVRPENPPQLHPQLLLVLGTDADEYVRDGPVNKVHLKSWNPEKFAEAVVLGAVREVLRTDDLKRVAHESVSLADATITANDLKAQQ
jgi:hypothetical protein